MNENENNTQHELTLVERLTLAANARWETIKAQVREWAETETKKAEEAMVAYAEQMTASDFAECGADFNFTVYLEQRGQCIRGPFAILQVFGPCATEIYKEVLAMEEFGLSCDQGFNNVPQERLFNVMDDVITARFGNAGTSTYRGDFASDSTKLHAIKITIQLES